MGVADEKPQSLECPLCLGRIRMKAERLIQSTCATLFDLGPRAIGGASKRVKTVTRKVPTLF